MGVLQFPTPIPATNGVFPSLKFSVFTDNLTTVTNPGYLNQAVPEGLPPLATTDVVTALYNYNQYTQTGAVANFSVSMNNTNNQVTLSPVEPVFPKVFGTESAFHVTTNGTTGVITTSSLNLASNSNYFITWTNSSIVPSSVFSFSIQGGTAMPYNITVLGRPFSGVADLVIYNGSGATLVGTLIIGFKVF